MKALGVAAAVALALGACSAEARADRVIVVSVEHSRFAPAAMEMRAGETVRFIVRNEDPIDHEFLIGDEDTQRAHEFGTEPDHGSKPGEISVPAGTTRETIFTFTEPGRLIFGCHIPLHYSYGMRGVIDIRP